MRISPIQNYTIYQNNNRKCQPHGINTKPVNPQNPVSFGALGDITDLISTLLDVSPSEYSKSGNKETDLANILVRSVRKNGRISQEQLDLIKNLMYIGFINVEEVLSKARELTGYNLQNYSSINSIADLEERERLAEQIRNIGQPQSQAARKQQIIDEIRNAQQRGSVGLGADWETSPLMIALWTMSLIPKAIELIPLCTTEEINAKGIYQEHYPILAAAWASDNREELLREFFKRDDVNTYVTNKYGDDFYKIIDKCWQKRAIDSNEANRLTKMMDDYRAAHPELNPNQRTSNIRTSQQTAQAAQASTSQQTAQTAKTAQTSRLQTNGKNREKLSDKEKIDNYLFELNKKFYNANIQAVSGEFKFEPPKENSRTIAQYNDMKSRSNDWTIFGYLAGNMKSSDEYDCVVEQMLQDKDFPIMKRYDSGYNIGCDPLFILTTLNKPYLLQQALKLKDANPVANTGMNRSISAWKRAVGNNILDCVYVMLKSGKISEEDIEEAKSWASTKEMRELLNAYPDIDKYMNEINNRYNAAITINVKRIEDVMTTPNVDPKFVDSEGNNILHIIAETDDELSAISMIENAVKNKGVNINAKNKLGQTPIELYLQKGKYSLVAKMLDLKADISIFNDSIQNTFAHHLVMSPDEDEAIRLLDYALANGYDINKGDMIGITPFMRACKMKKYKIMAYYINTGLSMNIQDNNGRTPLHFACMMNDTKEIEMLLNAFASTKIADKADKVPGDYLREPAAIEFYKMFDRMA